MAIPFVDLKRQHQAIVGEIQDAVNRVLGHQEYILGKEVRAFEEAWAEFTGAKYAIGCSNGTDAIILALLACGIGPGDEVITVSNTFFATVEAIIATGAKPVCVDVFDQLYNFFPERAQPGLI